MDNESHISSLIAYTHPVNYQSALEELALIEYVEIAATEEDQGKIICVIETPTLKLAEQTIEIIKQHSKVSSAALVYHHVESNDSLDSLMPSKSQELIQ